MGENRLVDRVESGEDGSEGLTEKSTGQPDSVEQSFDTHTHKTQAYLLLSKEP